MADYERLKIGIHADATGRSAIDGLNTAIGKTTEEIKRYHIELGAAAAAASNMQSSAGATAEEINRFHESIGAAIAKTGGFKTVVGETAAKTDLLKTKMGEAAAKTNSLKDAGGFADKALASLVKTMGPMIAGAVSFGALTNAIKGTVREAFALATEIRSAAAVTGISVEELQKLKYAAEQNETSFGTLTGAIKFLQKTSIMAFQNIKGEQARAFKTLGVSLNDANGELKSTTKLFSEVADALNRVENDALKTNISVKLFGASMHDIAGIAPLIAQGGDAIRELTKEADKLGLVLSKEKLDAIDDFGNRWAKFAERMRVTAISAFGELIMWYDRHEKQIDKILKVAQFMPTMIGGALLARGVRAGMGESAMPGTGALIPLPKGPAIKTPAIKTLPQVGFPVFGDARLADFRPELTGGLGAFTRSRMAGPGAAPLGSTSMTLFGEEGIAPARDTRTAELDKALEAWEKIVELKSQAVEIDDTVLENLQAQGDALWNQVEAWGNISQTIGTEIGGSMAQFLDMTKTAEEKWRGFGADILQLTAKLLATKAQAAIFDAVLETASFLPGVGIPMRMAAAAGLSALGSSLISGAGNVLGNQLRGGQAVSQGPAQTVVVQKAYGMDDLQGQIRSAQTVSNRRNLAWSS